MTELAAPCARKILAVLILTSLHSVTSSELERPHLNFAPLALELRLMHRDYENFPFGSKASGTSGTLRERFVRASERSRRRAQRLTSGESSSTILGDVVSPLRSQQGEYLTAITLGTPGNTLFGILDTGSDLVWVQCKPCPGCFDQPDPLFDPSKSSTFKRVSCSNPLCRSLTPSACSKNVCQYSYGYGDGSFSGGALSLEALTLRTTTGRTRRAWNFAFGCGADDGGNFAGSDGIVGFGWGSLSMMTQMVSKLGVVDRFSYCLVTFGESVTSTSPMLIGEKPPVSNEAPMVWTSLVRNKFQPEYYFVGVEDLSVNGKRLRISEAAFRLDEDGFGGCILDSGTILTYLESGAYFTLERSLRPLIKYSEVKASSTGLSLCYNVSGVARHRFPTITFHFSGADLVIPQENSFVPIDDVGTVCLSTVPSVGISILGNLMQQNFLVVHDRERRRVGFSPRKCSRQTFS